MLDYCKYADVQSACHKAAVNTTDFEIEGKGKYRACVCTVCGVIVYKRLSGARLHPGDIRTYLGDHPEVKTEIAGGYHGKGRCG